MKTWHQVSTHVCCLLSDTIFASSVEQKLEAHGSRKVHHHLFTKPEVTTALCKMHLLLLIPQFFQSQPKKGGGDENHILTPK